VTQSTHHDADTPTHDNRSPANRLGIDYRDVPARKIDCRIVDVHTHVHAGKTTGLFFEAADLYQVDKIVSMTPLDQVGQLQDAYGDRLEFIAIPRWREMSDADDFRQRWLADLQAFRERGARRMKFWVAPRLRGEHGLTLDHPWMQPLIDAGLDMEYHFMVHVGDPSAWFEPGGRYDDHSKFGSEADQYPQLEHFLEKVAPRTVIAAHMGGSIENPDRLDDLLTRYPHLYLDSSATKWIVRGVAAQPDRIRALLLKFPDRILFGSDLVVADKFDFDHYASRFWAHQMMWETQYAAESPIDDPDADPPQLRGLDLPADQLRKFYDTNAERLGY
jgi:predicted TIM-barrel fold metal-dependent hydrolase